MNRRQFGGKLTDAWKSVYKQSPNWHGGSFANLVKTQTGIDWKQLPGILCKQIKGHKEGYPDSSLPILPLKLDKFLEPSANVKFVWYGHSVILMRLGDLTILIDPMFGDDASPIAPVKTRRFSENTLDLIDQLPEIDLMLLSHDHYDHLDLNSIRLLKAKTKAYYVSLGVKRHLLSWGIDEDLVEEFDWWQSATFNDIQITFTPTRHFSGRGLTSMAKCLWGGWAFRTPDENIWFSGDSGYGEHFRDVGENLGPFDVGFMECGQYCVDWPDIHMFPEESVNAAIDARVRLGIPLHWGGFNLSYQHAWYEPVTEFVKYAKRKGLNYKTPALGEVITGDAATGEWWKQFV